ncbi:hypothetical protein GN956_G7392 [Arapaima gigas]
MCSNENGAPFPVGRAGRWDGAPWSFRHLIPKITIPAHPHLAASGFQIGTSIPREEPFFWTFLEIKNKALFTHWPRLLAGLTRCI